MNKKKRLLTIVIPSNRTQFLDEAIKSVLDQVEVSCEIVVVDDGAVPSIKRLLGKTFPTVNFIRHTKNRGLPASRNTGVKYSKTEFITFLDCDDLLEPNFAEEMIKACQKNKTDAAVCLPHFFFSRGFPLKRKILFFVLSAIRDSAILISYILNQKLLPRDGFFLVQSSHVVFKKELLTRFPSDETYFTAANDWKLMAEILAHKKVGILPKKLSRYRYHYNSQSQSDNKIAKWEYYDRMLKEIPDNCKDGILITLFRMYHNLGKIIYRL